MVLPLLVLLAATVQVSSQAPAPTPVPPAAARGLPPVALWLADSNLAPGARTRAFVRLRETSYLVVLRVDGDGKVSVIFPASPMDDTRVPGGATYEIPGPDGRASFVVREPAGTGTVFAARSATPLRFAALAGGNQWDYVGVLLFQPTAGDPLAALLDIVDRMTDGRTFDHDVATYAVTGPPWTIAAGPPPDAPCAGCDAGYFPPASPLYASSRAPGLQMFPSPQYAAPLPTVSADCSGAYITEGSSCASVTYNAAPTSLPSEAYVEPQYPYYPYYHPYLYYDPFFFLPRRVVQETVTVAPRERALALHLRRPPATRAPVIRPRARPKPEAVPAAGDRQVIRLSMPRVLRNASAPATPPVADAGEGRGPPVVRIVTPARPAGGGTQSASVTSETRVVSGTALVGARRVVGPARAAPAAASGGAAPPSGPTVSAAAQTGRGAATALPRGTFRSTAARRRP